MVNLSLEAAIGGMRLLANAGTQGWLDVIGVSRGDFDKFTGEAPWLGIDRNRMMSLIHTFANASLDAQGLPRINCPAEYIAAVIAIFVAPVNVHAACVVAPPALTAVDQGKMRSSGQMVTSDQLFALMVQLYNTADRAQARVDFERNTGLELYKEETAGDL